MKRIFILTLTLCSAALLYAQNTKPKAAAAPKTTASAAPKTTTATNKQAIVAPILKNEIDSFSYAMGISLASYYKSQGITELNSTLLSRACSDMYQGKPTLLDNNASGDFLNKYMTKLQSEKSKFAKAAGEKFLSENKKRPGVFVTESGLQYEVIQAGTGDKPGPTDTVTCHYTGTFIDGKKFDSSHDRPGDQPISFPLNGVIRGWTEGLQLMQVGAKFKFSIPYTLGYGENDYMSIPGGSTLLFEVELIDVKHAK